MTWVKRTKSSFRGWFYLQLSEMEESKAEMEIRYESRLSQLQSLNESLDASEMIESHEAELDKLRTTQVIK